ncbi:putative vesicle-associated membrane-protein-associated protein [Helianthus annuus]|nr:putative vesicle-associated membrane-protein-associated protein [Helianthus annuus]
MSSTWIPRTFLWVPIYIGGPTKGLSWVNVLMDFQVRSLISKLTDEKNAAIEQSNRIRQELELLRRGSNKSQGGGAPLMFVIIIGFIGLILGYIMKK